MLAENDDWQDRADTAIMADVDEAVGAFAFPAGSADAALLMTLEPGAYTTHVAGKSGSTGVSLVEVYALDGLTDAGA